VNAIEIQKNVFGIDADASDDRIAEAIGQVRSLKAFAREVEAALKERMLEAIEERGRDITIGQTRYYAGIESKTTCIDVQGAVESILATAGGDLSQLVACMASGALKPGATGGLIGTEEWKKYFVKDNVPVLKEGKPQKKLLEFNTAYQR
jgi:hypothetical protein